MSILSLDTGLSIVSITEAGKETTREWLSEDANVNKTTLPGGIFLAHFNPKTSFAYPIEVVVRAFSQIPVEDIFSRQVDISVIPTIEGLKALEVEGNSEVTASLVRKASFHMAVIDGMPFLVSEDEDFLRFPIGQRKQGEGITNAPLMEKVSASAMLNSLEDMGKVDPETLNPILPDKLNRLFLNVRAEEIVPMYQFQSGLHEPYVVFTKQESIEEAYAVGLEKVAGIKEKALDVSSNILWRSTYRFSWEGRDMTLVKQPTPSSLSTFPAMMPSKSSGKTTYMPWKSYAGQRILAQRNSKADTMKRVRDKMNSPEFKDTLAAFQESLRLPTQRD